MRALLRRMLSLQLARAWRTWLTVGRELRRTRLLLHKASMAIMHADLFAAWRVWCEATVVHRLGMAVMTDAATAWGMRLQSAAWATWSGRVRERCVERSRVQGAVFRLIHQEQSRAFQRWRAVASSVLRSEGLLRRGVARILQAGMAP